MRDVILGIDMLGTVCWHLLVLLAIIGVVVLGALHLIERE